jgi:hypothetical protein
MLVAVSLLATTAQTPSHLYADDQQGQSALPQYKVTQEELELAARFEDRPLFMGIQTHSVLHYPGSRDHAEGCSARGCGNGCTIGFGYNIGARSAKQVMTELKPILGRQKAKELSFYAGKVGIEAYNACGPQFKKANLPQLSRADSWELLKFSMAPHKAQVMQRIHREGLTEELNIQQVAVLVALDFQNPRLSSRATTLWKHLHQGKVERVAYEIRNNSGTRFLRALQTRRNTEADLWLASL